ncbi:recombination-associated protein RdgC [Marinomonas transparens]|uniref:Recombination-associated protein RdgC n=1 Tax=Marinomonas transparens TaxID=2795388 RepID=A0A934JQ27_9GAMM|nr:recombination-associated protein RdgC [Marinomonas transparens]MBJ7539851.1 recombination-associated protein RdgC [Marinomonas transparens]
MFAKNATILQLPERVDFNALESALTEFPLKEVGSQEAFSFGSMPLVRNSETWSLRSNDCLLIRFGKEEKNLPSTVVREALEEKVAQIELIEGRKVGRKEKADMKDELIFTLRPKAFTKRSDVWMHIDNMTKVIVIYSTTATMIELAFKHLQTMLGSFPMVPLQTQVSPSSLMADWLQRNAVPAWLETGSECDIQDNSEDKARITFKALEPLSEDVTRHLEQGMSVKSLALRWPEKISFTLHDDLTIRKIKWDDAIKEAAFNDSQGGGLSDLDASFTLTSLTIRQLYMSLASWFEIMEKTDIQEQAA